jgi:phage tail sheath protein FI
MPIVPTYPGVYVEEVPSGVRPITGVATSTAAFVGRTRRGPVDRPVRIHSFAEFERRFGGLWARSTISYAVQQFFLNGGSDAIIVRIHNSAVASTAQLQTNFNVVAADPGKWGDELRVRVDYQTRPPEPGESLFNLSVRDGQTGTVERFVNLSVDPLHPRFAVTVLARESDLVRIQGTPAARPNAHGAPANPQNDPLTDTGSSTALTGGQDGNDITENEIATGAGLEAAKAGMYRLEDADLFNLLCLPPPTWDVEISKATWDRAAAYCRKRRAVLIVDPPASWNEVSDPLSSGIGVDSLIARSDHACLFFPRIVMADPLRENRLREFAPCGAMAGVFARTDSQRGVWKAPAGIEATLIGVADLTVKLTDQENGQLNPVAVNCLRTFPVIGTVVWGSRTLRGADQLASEWKYVPVRRLALFIEESLYRGTQWVVFEPNDEPLWSQIRLNVGAFMHDLFRQGAFQGRTPREAYFVKCSSETTTQGDIDRGIVNIVVGFAPLQPAEFVIIKIQQIRDQAEA